MSKRKVWFITRPQRDPIFHEEAIHALYLATEQFKQKWHGNRIIHKKFEEELGKHGVKRKNISADGSGGRTWFAMLKTFAYCYTDSDGYVILTKSGEQILKGNKPYQNIKKQMLTLQIPNAYFLGPSFQIKFDDSFRIRPIMFLIELVHSEKLNYFVTKEEITFFALAAKKDSDLENIITTIHIFRNCSHEQQNEMKKEAASNNEHRQRSDKDARNYYKAHSDVAHSFMLISDYTGLVEYIRGDALRAFTEEIEKTYKELNSYQERYPFNTRYLISLPRMMENNGLDVDSYKASKFGYIKPAANQAKTQLKINNILKEFPDVSSVNHNKLLAKFKDSFPRREAEKIVSEIQQNNSIENLSQEFVEGYLKEENNLAFEDKTGEIFEALGFDVIMRPASPNGERTEIEILIGYEKNKFGIIDAKNYDKKFSLSASLASHMASEYIPNYNLYKDKDLKFFGYVTANEFGSEKSLNKITSKAKPYLNDNEIPGIIVNAQTLLGLLDYCIEKEIPTKQRSKFFTKAVKNKGYKTLEELLKEVII